MTTLADFIRQYDIDNTIKKAISNCICRNITKSVVIDVLASDLQERLYQYIRNNNDLSIDDGSNIERGFRQEIIDILTEYFNDDRV